MSLELGNIIFDGPHLLKEWNPLNFPAICAIMTKPDYQNELDTYQILYFCQASELSEIESYFDHSKYRCWLKKAGFRSNIYICAHLMPNSTFKQRELLKNVLIDLYSPICTD